MELELIREKAAAFVRLWGPEAFMEALDLMTGGALDLYSISRDWEYIPAVTMIKGRGAKGDVLVKLT